MARLPTAHSHLLHCNPCSLTSFEHLWAIEGVAQRRDAGEDLLHRLVEWRQNVVAALPQQHTLRMHMIRVTFAEIATMMTQLTVDAAAPQGTAD